VESTPQYGKTPLVCETAVNLQSGKYPEFELDKASKVVTAEPDMEAPECNDEATQAVNVESTLPCGKTPESTIDHELAAHTPQYGNKANGVVNYARIGGMPISKCVKTYRVLRKLLLHMTNSEPEHEHGPLHPNKVFGLDDREFYELVQHFWHQ